MMPKCVIHRGPSSARGTRRFAVENSQRLAEARARRFAVCRIARKRLDDAPVGGAEVVVRNAREVVMQRVVAQADRRPQFGPGSARRVDRIARVGPADR